MAPLRRCRTRLLDDGSAQYDAAAAADAEGRITQFFQATLPKPETVDLG